MEGCASSQFQVRDAPVNTKTGGPTATTPASGRDESGQAASWWKQGGCRKMSPSSLPPVEPAR